MLRTVFEQDRDACSKKKNVSPAPVVAKYGNKSGLFKNSNEQAEYYFLCLNNSLHYPLGPPVNGKDKMLHELETGIGPILLCYRYQMPATVVTH